MVQFKRMRPGPHFSCQDCGADFVTSDELGRHRREMHAALPGAHRCRLCGEAFGNQRELDGHLREAHGVEVAGTVPCGECGLVFTGPDALEEHMDQEHPQRAGMGQTP